MVTSATASSCVFALFGSGVAGVAGVSTAVHDRGGVVGIGASAVAGVLGS